MQLPAIKKLAIFADFDGTLVDIAPTPDAIVVDLSLKTLLVNLHKKTNKAFAVVTGRSLQDIQQYIGTCQLTIAANHGAQWQFPGHQPQVINFDCHELEKHKATLQKFSEDHKLLVENKAFGMAVHLRQKPLLEQQLDQFIDSLKIGPNYTVIRGKAVRELKPKTANKGAALERFMSQAPFSGKTPLFMGDDVTDEDGFRYINRAGGISIKVGSGETEAHHRLPNPADVRNVLSKLLAE